VADVQRRVIDEDFSSAVAVLTPRQQFDNLREVGVSDLVVREEPGFDAVVLVRVGSEQPAVVRRDVEVLLRDATRLAPLVDELEQLVQPVPEVVLPVPVFRIRAVQFLSDILFERVQTVRFLVNLVVRVE